MAQNWPGQEIKQPSVGASGEEWPGQEWPGQEVVQQPQQPKKTVGNWSAAGRGFMEGSADTANLLAMAAGGAGVLADKAVGLFTGKDQTSIQDAMFGAVDVTRDAQKHWAIDQNTEQLDGFGGTASNMAGKVGAILAQTLAMPGSLAVNATRGVAPIAGMRGAMNVPFEQVMARMATAPSYAQKAIPAAIEGAVKAQVPFAQPATLSRAQQLQDAGVDSDTVRNTAISNYLMNTIMAAAPASAAGNLAVRTTTGAAINAGTGAAQRGMESAILGDEYAKQAQKVFGGDEMTMDSMLGAVMAGLFGPRAAAVAKARADAGVPPAEIVRELETIFDPSTGKTMINEASPNATPIMRNIRTNVPQDVPVRDPSTGVMMPNTQQNIVRDPSTGAPMQNIPGKQPVQMPQQVGPARPPDAPVRDPSTGQQMESLADYAPPTVIDPTTGVPMVNVPGSPLSQLIMHGPTKPQDVPVRDPSTGQQMESMQDYAPPTVIDPTTGVPMKNVPAGEPVKMRETVGPTAPNPTDIRDPSTGVVMKGSQYQPIRDPSTGVVMNNAPGEKVAHTPKPVENQQFKEATIDPSTGVRMSSEPTQYTPPPRQEAPMAEPPQKAAEPPPVKQEAPQQPPPAAEPPKAVDGYIAQDEKTGRWKLSSPPPESMRDAVFAELDARNSGAAKVNEPLTESPVARENTPADQQLEALNKRAEQGDTGAAEQAAKRQADIEAEKARVEAEKVAENKRKLAEAELEVEVKRRNGKVEKVKMSAERVLADLDGRLTKAHRLLECLYN